MALTETDRANIVQEIIRLLATKGITLGEAETILSETKNQKHKTVKQA